MAQEFQFETEAFGDYGRMHCLHVTALLTRGEYPTIARVEVVREGRARRVAKVSKRLEEFLEQYVVDERAAILRERRAEVRAEWEGVL